MMEIPEPHRSCPATRPQMQATDSHSPGLVSIAVDINPVALEENRDLDSWPMLSRCEAGTDGDSDMDSTERDRPALANSVVPGTAARVPLCRWLHAANYGATALSDVR